MTSVSISSSVNKIGNFIFRDCPNITKISVAENNQVYDSREKCNGVIHKATKTLIIGLRNTTIPKSVTSIGNWAYIGNSSIKSIIIPKNIKSIGDGAFSNCFELTNIEIPESVTSIGKGAFSGCKKLKSIVIPTSITSISDETFYGTGLTAFYVPESVTSIGSWAFHDCQNLTLVTIGSNVTNIGWQAFYGCIHLNTVINLSPTPQKIIAETFDDYWQLQVPYGCSNAYLNAEFWNKFKVVEKMGLKKNTK